MSARNSIREWSVDESVHDEALRDVDDLPSIGGQQLIDEDWDDSDLLDSDENTADQRSEGAPSDFDQVLDRLHEGPPSVDAAVLGANFFSSIDGEDALAATTLNAPVENVFDFNPQETFVAEGTPNEQPNIVIVSDFVEKEEAYDEAKNDVIIKREKEAFSHVEKLKDVVEEVAKVQEFYEGGEEEAFNEQQRMTNTEDVAEAAAITHEFDEEEQEEEEVFSEQQELRNTEVEATDSNTIPRASDGVEYEDLERELFSNGAHSLDDAIDAANEAYDQAAAAAAETSGYEDTYDDDESVSNPEDPLNVSDLTQMVILAEGEEDIEQYKNNPEKEDFFDEEPPPPPPTSPPPLADDEGELEDDDDTTVTTPRSSKASSVNHEYLYEDIIYRAGNDRDGLPVVVLLPGDINKVITEAATAQTTSNQNRDDVLDLFSAEEEKLIKYCIDFIGEVAAKGPYVLIVAAAGETKRWFSTRQSFIRFAVLHSMLPRAPHRKCLKKLIVLHPDPTIQAAFMMFRRAVSTKFWKKLVYVRRVSDLDSLLQPNSDGQDVSLPLPEEVLFYDITGAVGMDAGVRGSRGSATGRQARVRAESEAPNPPSTFNSYWNVSASFGVPLATLAAKTPFSLPALVVRCVTYLCIHGVKTTGLFRVPGNADNVSFSKKQLASGMDIDLGGYWSSSGKPASVEDVHVCAAILKTFFRELPKPILTHAAYTSILHQAETESNLERLAESMKSILDLLPRPNRLLLQYLSYFMQYVLMQETYNQMTAQNLAIVWVPNLFRDESDPDDPERELRMLPHAMKAAMVMFIHPQVCFPIDASSILPICFDQTTGIPLPVNAVCVRDVTQSDLAKQPLELDDREFDTMLSKRPAIAASFSLRAVVESTPSTAPQPSPRSGTSGGSGTFEDEISHHLNMLPEPESMAELYNMSVRDLKRYLVKHGYDPTSCVEKSDLKRMAVECFKATNQFCRAASDSILEESNSNSPLMTGSSNGSLRRNSLRRSLSFDQQRRRKSSEGVLSVDSSTGGGGGSKRGSDLGRVDRRDSDVAFLSALRQAGLAVDESSVSNLSLNNNHNNDDTSSESTIKTVLSSNKRDFSQVGGATNGTTSSGGGGEHTRSGSGSSLMGTFLRRKSLLTRENKRDLAKSAKGIRGASSQLLSHLHTPTAPSSSYSSSATSTQTTTMNGNSAKSSPIATTGVPKRKLSSKGSSSSDPPLMTASSLEETARALKETPLFGEDRDSSGSRPIYINNAIAKASPADGSSWKLRDVDTMTIKDLKQLLEAHGKDSSDCRTMEDLRRKAKESLLAAVVDPFYFSKAKQ